MDSKSNCLSRKWLLRLGVTKVFKSSSVMIAVLLFFICAPNRMVHQVPQANAEQAQKGSTEYRGEQNSPPDDGHPSQVEYVEARKFPINQAADMQQGWYAIAYEARSAQIQHPDENEWPAILSLMNENGKAKQERFKALATGRGRLGICQYVSELAVVPVFENKYPQTGGLFVALGSSGGSGAVHLITLWAFDENARKFENILPEVTFSELGDIRYCEAWEMRWMEH